VWRALPEWRLELREANAPGRALAVFTLVLAAGAAFVSGVLLVG